MSNFKSDNPDPAKGTPATDTPFKSDNPDPAKGTRATEEQKTDDPQKEDPKKEAGIFGGCIASLCCCFAAEEVALNYA